MIQFGRRSQSALVLVLALCFLVPPQVYQPRAWADGGTTPPAPPPEVNKVAANDLPPAVRAELARQVAAQMNATAQKLRQPATRAALEARVAQGEAALASSPTPEVRSQLAADKMLLEVAKGGSLDETQKALKAIMSSEVSQQGLDEAGGQAFARSVGQRMSDSMGALGVASGDSGLPAPGGSRVGQLARSAGATFGDPVFIGAIGFQTLAMGAFHGEFRQSAKDFGQSLISPDFYAGVGMFNLTFTKGGALVDALGAKITSTAVGEAVSSKSVPLLGETVGSVARENIVLGMALTVPKFVSVDLNGFTFKDAVHLDFRKLKEAPIVKFAKIWTHDDKGFHWAPGIKSTFQDVGITLGSFVVAGAVLRPIMTRIGERFAALGLREAFAFAGKRIAARFIAAGAVEAGALAIPGAGEVIDGVLLVGNILWAAVDIITFVVAPRAAALGTTMLVANAIQKPVQSWNDQRQFDDATKDAVQKLLAVAAKNGGKPDPKELQQALAGTMAAFRDERDLAYLPAAIDDVTLGSRLDRVGNGDYEAAMRAKNEKISSDAQDAYGQDLFQLARTVAYKRAYDSMTPANASDKEAQGIYGDYKQKVARDVAAVYAAPTLDDSALDPTSSSFAISRNRAQLYDQESAVYARVRTILQDDALRSNMSDQIALLGAVKGVDTKLMKQATGQAATPAPASAAPAPATSAPAPQGNPEDGSPDFQPPRQGITDQLKKTNGN